MSSADAAGAHGRGLALPRAPWRAVILHGAHGGPDTIWFPWLHAALERDGVEVLRPAFPTPAGQSLRSWFDAYDRAIGPLPPAATALVGHSLGAAFALRLAERAERPFAALFLAAGFVGPLGLFAYDAINWSFFADPFVVLIITSFAKRTTDEGAGGPDLIRQADMLTDMMVSRFGISR